MAGIVRNPKVLFILTTGLFITTGLLPPNGRGQEESTASMLKPVSLRCEYRVNPMGIDVARPRLSWVLESANPDERGLRQTAYQILVATSRANLQANQADLWDSGRVESDQSIQVKYSGKQLGSGTRCWWQVRVWDQCGQLSAWSEPARWSMGLLHPADWKGHWISASSDQNDAHASYLRRDVNLAQSPLRATSACRRVEPCLHGDLPAVADLHASSI